MNPSTRWPRLAPPDFCRPGLVLGLLAALLVAAPDRASAQDQAFKNGMQAYDRKEWGSVAKLMRAALQADQRESPRKVEYGGFIGLRQKSTEYVPHYYLGEALYRMQPPDCAGAVDAWAVSEKQGVVLQRQELARTIQDGYVVCRTRGVLPPSEFEPQIARAQQQYADVTAVAAAVTALGQQNPEVWKPDIRDGYEQASADLETARQRIGAAGKTRALKDLTDATVAIDRARGLLTGLNVTVRAAVDSARTTQARAREAEQALSAAAALREQIEGRLAGGPAALSSAMSAASQRAQEALTRGRERYNAGVKAANAGILAEAKVLGEDASTGYKQVLDDFDRARRATAERQLAEARTSAAQAMRFVDELFVSLERRMAANPALAKEVLSSEQVARTQAATVRRRLDAAVRGDNVAAIVQATRTTSKLRDGLNELTARFGPLTLRERGVNEALEDGAAQFLAGRYQQALERLNPAEGFAGDDPLQLHVHLFRAASLYALYVQSGETRPELRGQAVREIEQCKKFDSTFQPDPRAFSPRFIALFRETGGTGGESVSAVRP